MQNTTGSAWRVTGCRGKRTLFRTVLALLLFFSGCALAQSPHSGPLSRPRGAAQRHATVQQRAESDFHYLLSHLLQFSSNQEDRKSVV